ncbi:hypothetical protein JCM8097_005926 [Rhodosporidiobolus ruineniae]
MSGPSQQSNGHAPVHPDVARDAARWQAIQDESDSFVTDLLSSTYQIKLQTAALITARQEAEAAGGVDQAEQERLHRELEEREKLVDARIEEATAQLREMEVKKAAAQGALQDALLRREQCDRKREQLEAQKEDLEARQREAATGTNRPPRTWGPGPPQTIVYINGNVAPFGDEFIQNGLQGGKDASARLREAISRDMLERDPRYINPDIFCWLHHDQRRVLLYLQANDPENKRLPESRQREPFFLEGFGQKSPLNRVVDVSNPYPSIAALLKSRGFDPSVQRIYLAGLSPGGLREAMKTLDDWAQEAEQQSELERDLEEVVWPKVVLINHQSDPLMTMHAPGPVVTIPKVFDSSISVRIFDFSKLAEHIEGSSGGGGPSGSGSGGGGAGAGGAGGGGQKEIEWSGGASSGGVGSKGGGAGSQQQKSLGSSAPSASHKTTTTEDDGWTTAPSRRTPLASSSSSTAPSVATAKSILAPLPSPPVSRSSPSKSKTPNGEAARKARRVSGALEGRGKEKENEGVRRKIDPNRGMLQQDVLTAGQATRLEEDVSRTGKCTYSESHGNLAERDFAKYHFDYPA